MSSSGQAKLRHPIRPVLNDSPAKSLLAHISTNFFAPAGRKFVELVMSLMRVAICISLQIREADVSNYVNMFELRELLEQIE
jgi:hypothetical protein